MPTRKSIEEGLTGKKSLICFVTAGDPSLDQLPEILDALTEGGADIIEVGIPFSDPIADGATIQASSQRALDRGIKVDDILEAIRIAEPRVPVVLMGYTNTALKIGYAEFAGQAAESCISGVILSDLPPDDCDEWLAAAKANSLDTIFLVAPTSTDERIQRVVDVSTGFIYCVSRTGVTGTGSQVPVEVVETVRRIKARSRLPVCVGFGISNADHVRMVCRAADGAVVGSHIVNFLHERGTKGLAEEVRGLRAAL